ncbi:class I SAM-dependent methyltransferase [Polaribacter sp.]|uniref:class I SAM-dependent DNA methyltransferase n=1 Tax=Polaribacter sp. TaxID=1920175 RepID=UPI0025EB3237|nr:class I SAM-dependent methyltransferase [Polaribacter sp.]
METKDWFTDWFNTPYYHILYKNRNDADAQIFMKNMMSFLNISKDAHLLDLPCGKGRHSHYLNSLGYQVTGLDLSENSIKEAKKNNYERLDFKVHDMRLPFNKKYDAIFNLFTSFGYFDDDAVDISILQNIKNGLKKRGVFVFDFLNVEMVKKNLVHNETKVVDGISFYITRNIKDGFIIKNIQFVDNNKEHSFTERVKYLEEKQLKMYFNKVGLKIQHTFGDYHLNDFDSETSNRLIFVAK